MSWGVRIGHIQFYRSKGTHWIETFRPWLLPIFGGAGLAKFFGFDTALSLLFAVLIPVIIEVGAIWLGRMEHKTGAIEAHFRLAAELDPYRADSLRLLRAQERLLTAILGELRAEPAELILNLPERPAPHAWAERK